MPKIKLGKDATISGAGINNGRVRSVNVNFEKGETDVSTRDNNGYRQTVGTLKDCTLEVELIMRKDSDIEDLRSHFESGEPQSVTFTEAGGAVSQKFEVMSVGIAQALEEGLVVTVSLKTTADEVADDSSGSSSA